jgi:hypothetical protein
VLGGALLRGQILETLPFARILSFASVAAGLAV